MFEIYEDIGMKDPQPLVENLLRIFDKWVAQYFLTSELLNTFTRKVNLKLSTKKEDESLYYTKQTNYMNSMDNSNENKWKYIDKW